MGKRTTRQYREAAHAAMYPLWHACNEQLEKHGETIDVGRATIKRYDSPGGAVIRRFDDVVTVEGEFVDFGADGAERIEDVTITFPADIGDLADANVDTSGLHDGSVGVRNYPLYARSMLVLVTGGQVGGGQIAS